MNAPFDENPNRLEALRTGFDESFRRPLYGKRAEIEQLLEVTLQGNRYALRLAELEEVIADRRLVTLPGGAAHLLGLASLRGRIVPIFDLAALLGVGVSRPGWRWLAIVRGAEPIGFRFESRGEDLRVTAADLVERSETDAAAFIRQMVQADGGVIPIVHLPSVVSMLLKRSTAKETSA